MVISDWSSDCCSSDLPVVKARFVLARQHRYRRLQDDGAAVHLRADEMHRAAGEAYAGLKHLPMGGEALEGGQERGMDVDQPVPPTFDETVRQEPHEAGEAHKNDATLATGIGKGGVDRFPIGKIQVTDHAAERRSAGQK